MMEVQDLFTTEMPVIGTVSMCKLILLILWLGFYIPDCEEKAVLKSIIEKHGGSVSTLHECHSYQL
jgi:hypothetical protein